MGDIYCLVCTGGEIISRLCSGDCSSCLHYGTGKCFKTFAKDEDEVERARELLLHLREPATDCNQLPKLTAEVFDRIDCPVWAKYAAVDRDGVGRVFEVEPMAEEDGWYSFGNEKRAGGGRYDAADWQNSLIERSEKTPLPDWCKVGEWVYYIPLTEYCKVEQMDTGIMLRFLDGDSTAIPLRDVNNIAPARPRPYNADEMKALVGRTVDSDSGTFLVTKFHPTVEGGKVCADTICYDVDELLDEFTHDGKPCGKLVHKEGDDWVE